STKVLSSTHRRTIRQLSTNEVCFATGDKAVLWQIPGRFSRRVPTGAAPARTTPHPPGPVVSFHPWRSANGFPIREFRRAICRPPQQFPPPQGDRVAQIEIVFNFHSLQSVLWTVSHWPCS